MKIEWLHSVRSLITLMIVGTYVTLGIKGVIGAENIQTITAMIITFYFAGKTRGGENEKSNFNNPN